MTWTKVTKATESAAGWGDQTWGSSGWGGGADTTWTDVSKPSDTWTQRTAASAESYTNITKPSDTWTTVTGASAESWTNQTKAS